VTPSTRRSATGRTSDHTKATGDHLNLACKTVKLTGDHFQAVVKIGDENVVVRAALNPEGGLRSVHIRY
jgi:hypothetical protein